MTLLVYIALGMFPVGLAVAITAQVLWSKRRARRGFDVVPDREDTRRC